MAALSFRPAQIGDAADIHALLLATAGDIPLAAETLEQEEALYAALRKLLAFGESWVAEEDAIIVGCVVVENVQTSRHWGENEALELRYATVLPTHRDRAILDMLIEKVLERQVTIGATVKAADRVGLAAAFDRLGFHRTETRTGQISYRLDP